MTNETATMQFGALNPRTLLNTFIDSIRPNLPGSKVIEATKANLKQEAMSAFVKIAGESINDGIVNFRDNYPSSIASLAKEIRTPEASSYESFRNALMFSAGSKLQRFGRQILARITWGLAELGGKVGSSFLDHWSGNKFEKPIVDTTSNNLRDILVSLAVRAIKPLETIPAINDESSKIC